MDKESVQTHWNKEPQEDNLKQGSNLKSLEAEITKRQKEGLTGRWH